jgi:septal ring factor EnvC (AmiA/AmiB activator)
MNHIAKEHLGQRILTQPVDITSPVISETRVLEFSPSGKLVKLLMHGTMSWAKCTDWELLEVMPDRSLIEDLQISLGKQAQECNQMEAQRKQMEAGMAEISSLMKSADESIKALNKQLTDAMDLNMKLREQQVADNKVIFQLKEEKMLLERDITALQASVKPDKK